jgi:hypothetical protein
MALIPIVLGQVTHLSSATSAWDEEKLARKIVADTNNGGLIMALYAAQGVSDMAEFKAQASQFALDHEAIGIHDRTLTVGSSAAMQMDGNVATLVYDLLDWSTQLLNQYPDIAAGTSGQPVKIGILAIFTHGESYTLQSERGGAWIQDLHSWAQQLVPYLTIEAKILLYACSTAGVPPAAHSARTGGLAFAEALANEIEKGLTDAFGRQSHPVVWGHRVPGHTTGNVTLAGYGGGAFSARDDLITDFSKRMAKKAILETNTQGGPQKQTIQDRAKNSIPTIMRVNQNESAPANPVNVYFREIPLLGFDAVWAGISDSATTDLGSCRLTQAGQTLMLTGQATFAKRFDTSYRALLNGLTVYDDPPAPEPVPVTPPSAPSCNPDGSGETDR